jgi:hypothetical protein
MTKAEIIAKTMKDMPPIQVQTDPPFSEEQDDEEFIISVLQDVLPDGVDIKVCDDFKHLNVECCETCHEFYPHYDMSLIKLPDGGKAAWVCDTVKWALYPEKYQAVGSPEGRLLRQVLSEHLDKNVTP